jgi:hypothetical protein
MAGASGAGGVGAGGLGGGDSLRTVAGTAQPLRRSRIAKLFIQVEEDMIGQPYSISSSVIQPRLCWKAFRSKPP